MANPNPTIVVASLDDSLIKKSINELVQQVNDGAIQMAKSMDVAVQSINESIKSLGKINVQIGKSTDTGTSKRTAANAAEANSVKQTAMAYDQMSSSIAKMKGGNSIIETYDMQLELLKQRLREVRADIDLYNQAIGSGKKTQIEFGQTGLKKANEEAEILMRQIAELERHRNSIANLGKPMGDTFKNYIDDLQKANPELAKLNQQFKNGNSLLQEQARLEQDNAKRNAESEKTRQLEAERIAKEGTILALKEEIALEKQKRDMMQTGTAALREQNAVIERLEARLKEELKSQKDINQEWAKLEMKTIGKMPEKELVDMENKLMRINSLVDSMQGKGILSEADMVSLTSKAKKLEEAINKIKNSPKTTNDVLGMPEKTLDDIAKKLQAIKQVSSQLNISTQRGEINKLNAEAQRLTKLQNDILGNNTKLTTSNRALASAIGYIRNRMIYALTLGATTNFVKQVYEVRGQYELLERSLGVLVNSFENGKKIFQDLNEMALKSPFTLIELGTAAKQLTAYNFEANEVVDVTRRLADISAALGVPMERLTYNLGQIRAQTVLTARDARDFANAGLPIVKTLSDYYTELEGKVVTTGDVYDRMSKKMVSYNDVMAVLYSMTDKGGKFFDFQAKQAETLRVQMANLTLAFNNMLNEIGESHQSTLSMPLKLLRSLLENWKTLSSTLFVVAGSFAAYKVAQMATNALVGVSVRSIQSQVLAEKQLEAVRLRKKAMTTKLTAEEKKLIANANLVNKADYERIMLERNMSASQAMRLIALNRNNILLQEAAVSTGILTKSQVQLAASGKYLNVALKSIGVSLKSLGAGLKSFISGNIYAIAFTLLASAAMEAYMAISNANEAVESIVNGINEAATESAKSIESFIETMKSAQVIEKATLGTLSKEEAGKAWKEMREELEKSSLISNTLISQLEQIPDINERIKQGGNIFENLKQAKLIVADIGEEFVKINDSPLGGILGEGLVDDLQDYGDAMKQVTWVVENLGYAQLRASDYGRQQMKNLESAAEEAKEEVDDTFNTFWKFVEKNNVTDPLMIAEMMENLKDKIKQENPKIKGELANLFDIRMDELLAERTNDAYDKNTSLWNIFMQKLKANYGQTFREIGEDINDLQQKAIDENVDYFRESMPLYYEAIKEMVQDASKLKIMIDVTFNKKEFSDLQTTFKDRIGPRVALEVYMPKSNEDVLTWASRLRKERKDYLEQEKALRRVGDQNSIREAERLKTSAINIADSLKAMNQPLDEEKSSSKSEKDELGEALKQQISLIKDMQSNYEKLRKAGVGDFEAIELAARGYEATLERVNLVLSKYGIDKFNANQFAGKNVKELLEFLVKQREILAQNPKVKTSAIEALDVEIQKLQVDAKTYDFKKITDGLNNELAKIDEQYELAVELQANADLGNQLIDMFGIDTTDFPKSIDDLVARYQSAVWDAIAKEKPDVDLSQYDILDVDFSKLFSDKDIDSDFMKGLLDAQKNIKQQTKKWAQDVYNQTKQLEYNLADTNGKIALKEQEINELRDKYANEQNAKQKELYALQIKEQENVLAELKEGILQMMPAYEALFGGIANHSAAMTRILAKRLKNAYEQAKERGKNEKGEYTYIDPKSGEYVTLTEHKLGIEIDKVNKKSLESHTLWQKLKEDFTKGADSEVDVTQGLIDIADEMEKVADGINEIGNIAEGIGANEETLEIINDIGSSISGIATAAKGIAQIQNGDIVGGTVNVIKGAWGAISSWFDNSNKRITREVERSERTVRQLELAYKDLEYQVEKSMGTAETAARRATIANKQQQLEELKRQLALEESRKKKNQDEDKMLELRSNIKDLQYEINNMTEEVVNNLTGSDVKSAAEEFVDTWVEAWKAGETTLDAIGEKMDEVIQNIVKKAMTQKIVGALLQPLYNELDRMTSVGSEGGEELTIEELRQLAARAGIVSNDINTALGAFYGNLEQLGLVAKTQEQEQQLSALQQGIQGVTEQTANALEGYMNGLSQQAYLRNDLLMQIRDALTLTDNDMAMGVQAQILLQLQQSYVLIQSIHSLMGNWTIPDGSGIRVQLL